MEGNGNGFCNLDSVLLDNGKSHAPGEAIPVVETPLEETVPGQGDVRTPLLRVGAITPSSTSPGRRSTAAPSPVRSWTSWKPSPAVIAVARCSIAYLLASLFTFVPALAKLLTTTYEEDAHGRVSRKPAFSAHMVATIVVYFHPAKSAGTMLLADRFCFLLAAFSTGICLLSMGTVEFFDAFSPSHGSSWDWISEAGDWIVCGLWVGGSMGFLAWAKVWVNNPSFNAGCSMAAVTINSVVIKEGNIPKLAEVLLIVLMGSLCTNITCFTIFPTKATTRLQTSISKALTSFSTLLDLLTSTFLLEKTALKENRSTLRDAVSAHAKAFQTLKTDLAEAKHERVIDPRIRGRKLKLYDAAIGGMGRVAQHLSGLRSSTRLQESLIRAIRDGRISVDLAPDAPEKVASSISVTALAADSTTVGPHGIEDMDIAKSVKLFLRFREIAGGQMKHLVAQCHEALDAVQTLSRTETDPQLDLPGIRESLARSLKEFTRSSSTAIKRLYAGPRRAKGVYEDGSSSSGEEGDDGDSVDELDELADGPNETVFLIYFFLFTLEEFAREMLFLLDTVSEIVEAEQLSAWEQLKSLFVKRKRKERRREYLYKQFQHLVPVDPSKLQPPIFPVHAKREQSDLILTHSARAVTGLARIRQLVWKLWHWLGEPDKRYAIKVWLAGAMLAAPAYTEWGRPVFLKYRGEWALIAFFATMSPTVGQTKYLSFFRSLGTILQPVRAADVILVPDVLTTLRFPENPIALPIFGFLFSIPCFYVMTQIPDLFQASRFVLLTYNLTCLYAYNKRDHDYTVVQIAFFRSVTVIIGVLWSAIVSRYWWPFTARRELRMGISEYVEGDPEPAVVPDFFCLDLSYLYSKLVTTYSKGVDPPEEIPNAETEQEPLLPPGTARHTHLSPGVRQFLAMELHLQAQLGKLRDLLKQTKNEPRLKGPFAFEFYNECLLSCERMLDRLHSMRCVTTRDEWDNGIRRAFVAPVNKQRREMAGSVILYFYTLSAGFRLRTPMPPYLPPAEQGRQRLVDAIRQLDVVKRRSVRGGGRHLLFFAYALAMQEVIAELDYLGSMMQDSFGVISQSTVGEFEELFAATPNTIERPRGARRVESGGIV
ncbi:hypothetical protein JCM24511_08639 [Saitozyma sp. JCM 24511]|nr:hypothetical protein JCM24511_08639 [Saitozyma sp. JCM 24511]